MDRAIRRRRTQLKRDKIKKRLRRWEWDKSDRQAGVMCNTFTTCSCWMCCNRRKIEGKSISELRSIDSNPI